MTAPPAPCWRCSAPCAEPPTCAACRATLEREQVESGRESFAACLVGIATEILARRDREASA